MADTNSDSDDGVYCELKDYIKKARMNLRKVKKRKPPVAKGDQDSGDNDKDNEVEITEEKDELEEEPIELSADEVNIQEKEGIEGSKDRDSDQGSEKGNTDKDNESIGDDNEKLEQDDELEKPNETDAIESDMDDIATSDNDGDTLEVEHEVTLSDEENHKDQSNKGSDDESDRDRENTRDRDEQYIDSNEEQNGDESEDENETIAEHEKARRSVSDLKNRFERNSESFSNNTSFRRFTSPGSDHEDENINDADEETNDSNKINEGREKQNTDDELQATDDDSSTVDAFNVQYRYALRHTKSMRRSQQPSEDITDDNNDDNETSEVANDDSNGTENTGALRASEIAVDSEAYNDTNERMSTYNDHLLIAQATIERLYDYIFKDPWEVLNQILDSKRSSKSSTEIDGIMSSPQKIFYTNEENIKAKIEEEIELEHNIENCEELIDSEDKENIDLRLNTRALTKEAKTYELERFDKNILIIFNQERIVGYKPRLGTRQDVEALTQTFSPYGFDVIEHLDLNRDEIFEELKRLTEMNFTNYGCLAIAVLTHGSEMDGLRAKDRLYYQNDIIKYLKTSENPTLVTKPKVLIIQACRGSESTYAITVGRVGKITKDYDDVDEHRTYTLPVEADILIIHSTFAGKTSHRDELNGTWFIQTLCNKINELAPKEDLESIITEVKKEVAIEKSLEEYNRRTFDFDTNKQIPVIVSTLIRKLYLKKNNNNTEEDANLGDAMTDGSNPVSSSRLPNCLCIFDRFEYLKNCMRYFLEDNDDDVTGRSFLDVAETLSEGYEFYAAKEQLSKAMSNHLLTMAKDCDYYKFLYFYKDGL